MTVRPFKDGKYFMVDFRFDTPDGRKRCREVCEVPGKRAAQDFEARRRRELEEEAARQREEVAIAEQQQVPTIQEFINERWLPVHPIAAKHAAKTLLAREWAFGLINVGVGSVPLDEITDERVERFAAELAAKQSRRGKPYSDKSVKDVLALLKQVLGKARRWKVISEVPEFPRVTVPEQPFEHLTADETGKLLDALRDDEERVLVLFALRTGARPGEQIALEWTDIDWTGRTVEFSKQIASGQSRVTPTKTRRVRSVPLASDLLEALKRRRCLRRLVFCKPDGSPCDVHAWHTILHRGLRKAGLRQVSWYALRHSFGSQASAAGVPLNEVQRWMGHSTITMTMRYVHGAPNAGDWIEKLVGQELGNGVGNERRILANLAGS